VYSEGPENLPRGVGPFNIQTEKLIVTSLLSNIIEQLKKGGIVVDCDPYTSARSCSNLERPDILVIGGDHAELTGAALQQRGAAVQLLHIPSYRSSTLHAGKIREGLASLEVKANTWIVVQVFDSALYMAAPREGGMVPPCRRADGSMHVDGDLIMITKDLQYEFFRQLDVELTSLKHQKVIFMAPLPRYYLESCCEDPEHVGNRSQPDYKKKLEDSVFTARANLKNFAFRHGYRQSQTISSWAKVRKLEEVWESPVRMKSRGYEAMAEAILEAGVELEKKRKNPGKLESPAAKKPRLGSSGGGSGGGEDSSGGGDGGGGSSAGRGGGGAVRGGDKTVGSRGGRGRGGRRGSRGNRGGSGGGGRGAGGNVDGVGGGGVWRGGYSSAMPFGRGGQNNGYQSDWYKSGPSTWRGRGGWTQPRGHPGPQRGGGHFFKKN
jgi:uncharacterized membrane protein YgcG